MESRRLSRRRAGALRRLPYPAQCARRGTSERAVCRRRRRQLAGLCDQRAVAGAGAVGRRRAVHLSAPGLASRSRRRARADGRGGQQSVVGQRKRRARDRDLYGRRFRRADAGSQASSGEEVLAQAKSPAAPQRWLPRRQRRRRLDLCRGLRDLPRDRPAAALWRRQSRALDRAQQPRSAQRRQHRAVGRSSGRGRAQPDHAGLCRQHERRPDRRRCCSYLRARFSNQPAWTGVEKTVADARRTQTVFLQTSPGPHNAPADTTQRDKP